MDWFWRYLVGWLVGWWIWRDGWMDWMGWDGMMMGLPFFCETERDF